MNKRGEHSRAEAARSCHCRHRRTITALLAAGCCYRCSIYLNEPVINNHKYTAHCWFVDPFFPLFRFHIALLFVFSRFVCAFFSFNYYFRELSCYRMRNALSIVRRNRTSTTADSTELCIGRIHSCSADSQIKGQRMGEGVGGTERQKEGGAQRQTESTGKLLSMRTDRM